MPIGQTGAYRRYRDAVRRRVCAVCLDGGEDGTCRLSSGPGCAVEELLGALVAAVHDVRAGRATAYATAVEARVCSQCRRADVHGGVCRLRQDGRCAVVVYLPLLVEAIEQVDDGDEAA
jgi:hypothetical protein